MGTSVGKSLGRYTVLNCIGAGGMGEVYRARDPHLGRDVAIKVLPEGALGDRVARDRFRQEALTLSQVSHPNIAVVFDFDRHRGTDFIVMEYIPGKTLAERLREGPPSESEVARLGVQLAQGLAAAHQRGIIHRDIKPGNILLTPDGWLKILDFGLAELVRSPDTGGGTRERAPATTVVGTLAYMAPELLCDGRADPRCDLYASGAVLFELGTGQPPFGGSTVAELLSAILSQAPPRPSVLNPRLSRSFEHVVLRALEKSPDQRYQTARELLVDLDRLRTSAPLVAPLRGGRPRRHIDSLAVFPFENASGDPELEYLSDGVTESLIGALSGIPKLRVVPRGTMFRYKGRADDVTTAARELGVRGVVTGRVTHREGMLVIRAELIDTELEKQIWGGQVRHPLADIFAAEDAISHQISDGLRLMLTHEERKQLQRRTTQSAEAYQLYLRGRYHWYRRTPDALYRGIGYFQQALEVDPTYSLALSGLADCFLTAGVYSDALPGDVYPRAKAAALRALELDASLAEARASLGFARLLHDWDWRGAEESFQNAIETKPAYATAHHWYSEFLQAMGRLDEALAEAKRAVDLDPLSLIVNALVGWAHYRSRRYEDAESHLRRVLDMEPSFVPALFFLSLVLAKLGRAEEGIGPARLVVPYTGQWNARLNLVRALGMAGHVKEARAMMEETLATKGPVHLHSYWIALARLGLGEHDAALVALEQAVSERSPWLVWLSVEPVLDPLRDDPRFAGILREVGLPG